MILHLSYDTTRIGLAIRHWPTGRDINDWRNLYLHISPGQSDDCNGCETGGSPWYLWGCWPGKPTGIDVANPRKPDFEPFLIPAHDYSKNGLIVFILPERWRQIAYGRYTGKVWYMPQEQAVPLPPVVYAKLEKYKTPNLYSHSVCEPLPQCETPLPFPKPEACTLAKFDIDYGFKCSEHIIQEANIELALAACEEDI